VLSQCSFPRAELPSSSFSNPITHARPGYILPHLHRPRSQNPKHLKSSPTVPPRLETPSNRIPIHRHYGAATQITLTAHLSHFKHPGPWLVVALRPLLNHTKSHAIRTLCFLPILRQLEAFTPPIEQPASSYLLDSLTYTPQKQASSPYPGKMELGM